MKKSENKNEIRLISFVCYLMSFYLVPCEEKNREKSGLKTRTHIVPVYCLFFFCLSHPYCCRQRPECSPERRCSSRTFRYGYLVTT